MVLHSFVHQVIEYLIQLLAVHSVARLIGQLADSSAALLVGRLAGLSAALLVGRLADLSAILLVDLVFLLSASRSSTQDQTDHSQAVVSHDSILDRIDRSRV